MRPEPADSEPTAREGKFLRLDDSIQRFLQKKKLASRIQHQPIFDAFRRALADDAASGAQAQRFAADILEVQVSSAALLHELRHFQSERILQKIREQVPASTIRGIRFRLASNAKIKP